MNDASSDAMKTIALASSSERPRRAHRNGRHQSRLVLRRAGEAGQHAGVRGTGATAFTRIPDLATSSATDLVRPSTACLLPT